MIYEAIQVLLPLFVIVLLAPFLGEWIGKILEGKPHFLSFLRPIELGIYALGGVDPNKEMNWKEYLKAILAFTVLGILTLFLLQLFQASLPINPQHLPPPSWHLALNTAISFVTNTNWQAYGGEATMSYFTQMVGLGVQNFISAATGIAVLVALARALRSQTSDKLGNFWVDLTRTVLYLLVPLSLLLAVGLISQGVIQNFSPYVAATTIEGAQQNLPMGPAASQIAIKQLGTNGGGFFNTNSAHPYENPTPFSNWLQLIAILLIPAALPFAFGKWVNARKQGAILFGTMLFVLVVVLGVSLWSEFLPNPSVSGRWFEGKETRLGVTNSVVWSIYTTLASSGSVNTMHSSLTPLSGGIALFNMMLGEVIFGGVGSGLYGLVIFAILTVFIAGLLVGRTPEYLGKKIEAREIQLAILALLAPNAIILIGTALTLSLPSALASLSAKGPHGFTEVLYAITSGAQNNGSAFAGLNANTPYFNLLIGIAMLVGRFGVLIPVLGIAGSLAIKKVSPPSPGTFPTDTSLFALLLLSVILIVGALTFFPALCLGPILEHMLWRSGNTF